MQEEIAINPTDMKIIDEKLIEKVTDEARKSLRLNYNFHQSLSDKCHRFLNALEPGTQIPVHHHPTKDETVVILKGKVRVGTTGDHRRYGEIPRQRTRQGHRPEVRQAHRLAFRSGHL